MKVYVTGLGLVTALGKGIKENKQKLESEESGIGRIQHLKSFSNDFLAGEYDFSNQTISDNLGIKYKPEISRTALLGLCAAKQIDRGNNASSIKSGFINGSTVGGMDRSELYYQDLLLNDDRSNFGLTLMHDLGSVTNFIQSKIGEFEYVNTISTACSSSANSILLAARLIQSGKLDRVIAGGSDSLSSFTLQGFHSLMIYDKAHLKPFDENRNGLNLGEGAGYLQLESEKSIKMSGNSPLVELTGWFNANDAYHQTATSPEGRGPSLAIEGSLKKAGLLPEDIDYINAHGTGTKNNDQSELTAIESVFDKVPAYSSTKSFMGHTLGAAGGIEAVLSVMSITNNSIYPTLNWQEQMSGFKSKPSTKFLELKGIRNVLSNSFGFGGNSTSLIFSGLE